MFKKLSYLALIFLLIGLIFVPSIASGPRVSASAKNVHLVLKDNALGDSVKGLVARNCTNPMNSPDILPAGNSLSSAYQSTFKKETTSTDILDENYVRITGLSNNGRFNRATASGDSLAYCYNYRPYGSVGDIDGDGHVDFITTASGAGSFNIYFSNGDGTFISIKDLPVYSNFASIGDSNFSMPGIGDFNGDGISDIALVPLRRTGEEIKFVMIYGAKDRMSLRPIFTTSSANPMLKQNNFYFNGVTVGDLNKDNRPDIIVEENFTPFALDYTNPSTTDGSAAGFKVYMGTGSMENPFIDKTLEWGFKAVPRQSDTGRYSLASKLPFDPAYSWQSNLTDIDQDGFVDLLMISDFGTTTLYYGGVKNGETYFSYSSTALPKSASGQWMGSSILDVNHDGLPDIFLTDVAWRNNNCVGDGRPCDTLQTGNVLLVNQGDRKFTDQAKKYGLLRTGWSWGSAPIDLDNDGRTDLVVGNGMASQSRTQDGWQFSVEKPYIMLSGDDGVFTNITETQSELFNPESFLSAIIPIDANEDGAMDFIGYSLSYKYPVLTLNKAHANSSITLTARFVSNGLENYCWGCKITVESLNGKTTLWQGAFGRSFGSQGELPLVFGTGNNKQVRVKVTYPDLTSKSFKLQTNKKYILKNK